VSQSVDVLSLPAAAPRADGEAARPSPRRLGRGVRQAAVDLLRGVDVAWVGISGLLADVGYRWAQHWRFESDYLKIVIAGAALTPLVFAYHGAYERAARASARALLRSGVRAALALFLSILVLGVLMKLDLSVSRLWFLAWFALAFAGIAGARVALGAAERRLERAGVLRETVAVVGATPLAGTVIAHLRRGERPVEILGVFEERRAARAEGAPEVDGSISDLIELGKRRPIDRVILALPWSAEARIRGLLTRLMALSVDVSVCPDEVALSLLRMPVDDLSGLPTLRLAARPLQVWTEVAKRCEDVVLSLLILLPAAPAMLLIALLIRLESPGPALFRQRRHGYNNREITVLKFRTMRVAQADASGARQTARDDDRITPLGRILRRLSLDELPQLLNVLRGDMSLVGPRPHPIGMRTENLLGEDIIETYAHRHRVKPGLTGWAQVHGYRGATENVEALMRRVEYDLDYIERCSVMLDLRILMMTPLSLLTTRNAF
jgi:Undecaprenyl-phosphate glucose phosphotransferase